MLSLKLITRDPQTPILINPSTSILAFKNYLKIKNCLFLNKQQLQTKKTSLTQYSKKDKNIILLKGKKEKALVSTGI